MPTIVPKPPAAPVLVPAQLKVMMKPAPGDHAGQRRAGLLCMPNGSLHVRDFVATEADLRVIVDQALKGQQPLAAALVANGTTLTISLTAIRAKLCARAWGAFGQGDHTALSGSIQVTFDWSVVTTAQTRHAAADIALDVAHDDAAVTAQILRRTVDRLIKQIVQSGQAA